MVSLAQDDDTFLRDCWACLNAIEQPRRKGAPLPPLSDAPTALERTVIPMATRSTLAYHRSHPIEYALEIDAGVPLLFHGAAGMADVPDAVWFLFLARVRGA